MLTDTLAHKPKPGASIPGVCADRAETGAAYRLLGPQHKRPAAARLSIYQEHRTERGCMR